MVLAALFDGKTAAHSPPGPPQAVWQFWQVSVWRLSRPTHSTGDPNDVPGAVQGQERRLFRMLSWSRLERHTVNNVMSSLFPLESVFQRRMRRANFPNLLLAEVPAGTHLGTPSNHPDPSRL